MMKTFFFILINVSVELRRLQSEAGFRLSPE
jgi:hypothetical protein